MSDNKPETKVGAYSAPHLLDYGPVSELTQTLTGDTGDDNGYPSYTAST